MDHLTKLIESRYECATMGAPESKTEFGVRYTDVVLGGIKEIAENKFLDYFCKVLPPVPGGTLVWRMYPKTVQEGEDWTIWARAVVEVH